MMDLKKKCSRMLSITDKEFFDIRQVMFDHTGVRLRDSKRSLVISRLRRRLEELGCDSFTDYMKKLTPGNLIEIEYFVNALTTNETFFFRHTKQFNYLYEVVLPEFAKEGKNKIEIWSAASSTGEESYSIAITVTEFSKKNSMDFKIFASDINSDVLQEAKEAIYNERALAEVPKSLYERYLKRVANSKVELYSVAEQIKRKVEFFEHNLQKTSLVRGMDIIFLRNVLIYFERDIKEKVINNLEPCLRPGGYFFIGPSESLNDINTGLRLVGPSVFRKPL